MGLTKHAAESELRSMKELLAAYATGCMDCNGFPKFDSFAQFILQHKGETCFELLTIDHFRHWLTESKNDTPES